MSDRIYMFSIDEDIVKNLINELNHENTKIVHNVFIQQNNVIIRRSVKNTTDDIQFNELKPIILPFNVISKIS